MIIDTHTHLLDGDWLCAFSGLPTAPDLIAAQDRFGEHRLAAIVLDDQDAETIRFGRTRQFGKRGLAGRIVHPCLL